ncbi:glucan 1,4-alpha-glucosidase [Halostella sp. JP-L12]|uniref:glucan 1,4-alpha-glucosidase n=1 Tax=Halostella TaxID=1843185 RepID=UPI000EF85345|nr:MULTISPECIES: glucan 1,4-alpha-glucosidase [Halostella]NHN49689.1 glucan 1,4-alpha-glucosidase [Halostella sp. JP-L12]
MQFRVALDDFKRNSGRRFPEEHRTTGAFSGGEGRLVHVAPTGALRDYGYPLSGLYGVQRSRLGISVGDRVRWFDELDPTTQRYRGDTALVETRLDAGEFTVRQYDLTLDDRHLTRIELRGDVPDGAELVAAFTAAPDGTENRVGNLDHGDAVEVFHHDEHDYFAADTAAEFACDVQAPFDAVLGEDPVPFPSEGDAGRYESDSLTPNVVVRAPLSDDDGTASVTLGSLLADHGETDREAALSRLTAAVEGHGSLDALLDAARDRRPAALPEEQPLGAVAAADLRTLDLLAAPTGARVAGPDFDPFYAYSGGYGYTWFRDDAEITRYLAEAGEDLGVDVADHLCDTAAFYCDTQGDDGTWPHRVWPRDGTLAPGWANGRIEDGDGVDYQADQTASVVSFLADYLRRADDPDERVADALAAAVDGLDDSLADDGLPVRCQNAWENMNGRFAHTAATFLQAYATVADAPVSEGLREHARERAHRAYEGVDRLWVEGRGVYALREDEGELDERLDSGTLALVEAHRAYEAIGPVDETRRERLVSHVEATIEGLRRDPDGSEVRGLARFEGDPWRVDEQADPKVWSVSTGWGAVATAHLALLTGDRSHFDRAGELLSHLLPDGPLTTETGLLAEQVFDDGTLDSATPLGWSHALRLRAIALLAERDELPQVEAGTPAAAVDD